MRTARMFITKKGRAKYSSHLDMQRMMMRAVRRAGIELWYTEGFNPHPYITFAMPLSLGIESEGEPVDVRLEGEMTDEEVFERMNSTLPEGIRVTRVRDAVMKPNMIAFAEYVIELEGRKKDLIDAAISSGELPAEKTGKAGRKKAVKEINCCDMIGSAAVTESGGNTVINAILACGSEKNLSPLLLLKAIESKTGVGLETISVTRKRLLTEGYKSFE